MPVTGFYYVYIPRDVATGQHLLAEVVQALCNEFDDMEAIGHPFRIREDSCYNSTKRRAQVNTYHAHLRAPFHLAQTRATNTAARACPQ